ncbi:hypothetical protein LSCM1_07595 [Leishmania martiniquensis]|uniref:Uncharacterized protein n=1 Tax=Leishmania martiniquensis TaxID=1580590 RepID=A0A836KSA8_9TRYP|nr:hypothetical protein LSCM1_07595 [Leishmania martiniquensis]
MRKMVTPSPLLSSSAAARGVESSPFVPCTEDSAHTRRVGRHPTLFQRTLSAVSYRYLAASSRLARAAASSSGDHMAESATSHTTAAVNAAHAAYVTTLTESYQELWQQRGMVPKAARREWFETVLVHLKALNALGATLAWLTDDPNTAVTEVVATAIDGGTVDDRLSTTGSAGPSGSIASAALSGRDDEQRMRPRMRKSASDPIPQWALWQDAQRHLHHLTLRLHRRPAAPAKAYEAREAMRMSDLTRMDSSAFAWRVRQWCHIAALFHSAGGAETAEASSWTQSTEKVHPGMIADVVRRLSPTSPASPFSKSFAEEEPDLARMLLLCLSANSSTAVEDLPARRHVAGALVYRMLLEVTLGRLRALPRCIFTWRLCRDVLRDHLIAPATGLGGAEKAQRAVLLAITAYVEAVIIPYLEHRDCHLESLRHTSAQVHIKFTHLASAKLAQLRAAVASASAEDGNTDRAGAQSAAVGATEMTDTQSAATAPSAVVTAEGSDKQEQDRLPEAQRRCMAASMELLLRRACVGGAAAFSETNSSSSSIPHAASEPERLCAPDIVVNSILGNAAADDNAELLEASHGHHGDAATVPSGMREDEFFSIRCDIHRKRVDDGVLHSPVARISQLRLFLYHYFTQSPMLAFDRVSGTAAAAPADAEVGDLGEAE